MSGRRNGLPLAELDWESPNQREPWMDEAMCAQTDPEVFFPEKGGSLRDAKRLCESCDVKQQCLEYALRRDVRFGVWGGLSERERRRLRSERDSVRPVLLTSEVERVIRGMVADGHTNVTIGKAVLLAPATVRAYRRFLGLPGARAGRRSAV